MFHVSEQLRLQGWQVLADSLLDALRKAVAQLQTLAPPHPPAEPGFSHT